MHQWVRLHSLYHIVEINRHFQIWAWVRLQLLHPDYLLLAIVTLEDKIEEKTLAKAPVVVGDLQAADTKDATLSRYLRPRRLQN
jgi:hypothetical protein